MLETVLLILVCWFLFALGLGLAMGRVIRGFEADPDGVNRRSEPNLTSVSQS